MNWLTTTHKILCDWNLSNWKDFATIVGVIVAVATFIKGVWEYNLTERQKRAEKFFDMSQRLYDEDCFNKICVVLHNESVSNSTDKSAWKKISTAEKYDFLALFEEVAVCMNSGLIRREVAFNFFGYYAILCKRSDNFWNEDIEQDSIYWAVFKDFASQMEELENKPFDRRKYKF